MQFLCVDDSALAITLDCYFNDSDITQSSKYSPHLLVELVVLMHFFTFVVIVVIVIVASRLVNMTRDTK